MAILPEFTLKVFSIIFNCIVRIINIKSENAILIFQICFLCKNRNVNSIKYPSLCLKKRNAICMSIQHVIIVHVYDLVRVKSFHYFDYNVGLRKRFTCVWSAVVAICFAVNRRQRRLCSRLHVRFALAVSRVAVLFHNLDFRLQTEHKLFPSVFTWKRFCTYIFAFELNSDRYLTLSLKNSRSWQRS